MRTPLVLSVALTTIACSSATPGTPGPGVDAGPADAPITKDAGNQAPANLRSFESNAEGISDACKASDFVKAKAILDQAKSNWSTIKPLALAAGTPQTVVDKVEATLTIVTTEIAGSKKRDCETDANVLTLVIPDIFDHFTYAVPSDALRGDGVFRQLQIDSEYSDFTTADADLAAANAVWVRLRPVTVTQAPKRLDIPGAGTVVADTDATLTECKTAIANKDVATLATASQAGLDEIDTIETIFK